MQTALPIQVSGAGPAPQRAGASPGPNAQATEFGATLSREIAQRQAAPAKPAPAKPASNAPAPVKPQADKGAPASKAPAREESSQADPGSESATAGPTKAAETEDEAVTAAEAAAVTPVTDMLALVASFNQSAQAQAAQAPIGQAASALADAGFDAAGLALQAAVKDLGKESADGKASAGAADFGAALAAAGDSQGFDPRALREPALSHPNPRADAAQLGAQAREAAFQAAALNEPASAPLAGPAQAARLEAAQAAASGNIIPARVGTSAWDDQVGQKIVWMVGKEQSATLTLNPPDLGPLQVVLSVTNDQASVAFSANQQEVRQALENALPRLREMMSESGIALGNATVDAGMPDQRQAQESERGPGGDGSRSARFESGGAMDEATPRPSARAQALAGRGMVDTFA